MRLDNSAPHGFFDTKFLQAVGQSCSGSDNGDGWGRATLRSACTLRKERASRSCTGVLLGRTYAITSDCH